MLKNKIFKISNTYYKKQDDGNYVEVKLENLNQNTSECIICKNKFIPINNKFRIISLPCGHVFHKECIKKLYNKESNFRNKCPLCRAEFNNPAHLINILGRNIKINTTLHGHTQYVESVAYSPDGRNIVSGSADKSVKVWDADTNSTSYGACVATVEGHSGEVRSVSFSPDGKNIVSGSFDNTIKIWTLPAELQNGGKKNKIKNKITTKKDKSDKPKKLIDTLKKSELVKIAKIHDVSLKTRDDKVKTKLQLFNSLKRKKLI